MNEYKSIESVLEEHTDSLMAIDGVFGVAIGMDDGEKCIQIQLSSDSREILDKLPKKLDGYKVCPQIMDSPSLFDK